MELQEIRI